MAEEDHRTQAHRNAMLAEKGKRLYRKYCGTGGRGICAESFAVYHIGRGEEFVAADLADHLDREIAAFEQSDPHRRLEATRGLAARIRRHMAADAAADGLPRQLGEALRQFVLDNNDYKPCDPGSNTNHVQGECDPCGKQ
jgi:hypothetical protein